MALPANGKITLDQVNIELDLAAGTAINMGSSDVRGLFEIASGIIKMSDGYGKSSSVTLSPSSAGYQLIGSEIGFKEILASTYVSAGGTLIIPSGYYIWSNTTGNPAFTIDVACTVINNGYIIGRGGDGGIQSNTVAEDGSSGIQLTASGADITNASGAYICGGGGGGGYGYGGNFVGHAIGGGGAGGGIAWHYRNGTQNAGGAIGLAGVAVTGGNQAGAGGGGGFRVQSGFTGTTTYAGSGGRIPAGSGGTSSGGGNGGGTNNNGTNGGTSNAASGGGGGGWGASGGDGRSGSVGTAFQGTGGGAGKAVDLNNYTYTLTDNGTIYGTNT
tara:strand:- start:5184 stop:6173 length:990 start_codon:yes stop_codon:yes gene_type:complete